MIQADPLPDVRNVAVGKADSRQLTVNKAEAWLVLGFGH